MSLLTYSGITTKVRAMESRLFTEEQFREMAALEDDRELYDDINYCEKIIEDGSLIRAVEAALGREIEV
jgi:vacuolar-type H+-ATPase subunit C/Vma6